MPRWAKEDNLVTFLPNLVSLWISECSRLECLPSLGELRHLKSLYIIKLPSLEYIEDHPTAVPLFPCLEYIYLEELPKLKRWWKRSVKSLLNNSISNTTDETPYESPLSLFRLKKLDISDCPELASIPVCPNVEELELFNFSERLEIIRNKGRQEETGEVRRYPKLRQAGTDNMAWLHSSLPMEAFQSLVYLGIDGDKEIESLREYKQVFGACSSSLQTLGIWECPKLKSISGGLRYLPHLKSLFLRNLPIASMGEEEREGDEMPWGSLCHSLQYLDVYECKELKSIPEWFRNY